MSRSLKKGPYIDFKLEKKVDKLNSSNKKEVVKKEEKITKAKKISKSIFSKVKSLALKKSKK